MFWARCRRTLFQDFTRPMLHGRSVYSAPTPYRHFLTASPTFLRPTNSSTSRILFPQLHSIRHGSSANIPFSQPLTPTFSTRFDEEGNDLYIQDEDVHAIIQRINQGWPTPPSNLVPVGWSADWEAWPYLLTYYWLGPYYLLLPQIEMLANVKHRIPGETRPVLYSTTENAFIFTLVEDPTKLYYLNAEKGAGKTEVWRFDPGKIKDEQELVRIMGEEGGVERAMGMLGRVEPDAEGEDAIRRIFDRDETVIPVLASKFLDYTPVKSMPWEETGYTGDVQLSDEEEVNLLREMAEEAEKYAEEHGIDLGEDEEGDLAQEEEAEDFEPDELEKELDMALENLERIEEVDWAELGKLAAEEDERDRKQDGSN